jgi:hypothetical protein
MSNCFFYLSAYYTKKKTTMITMATKQPIQQRTKEKPKNKQDHIYIERERQREKESARERDSHYSDWARRWVVEIYGFDQTRKGEFYSTE